MVKLLLRQLQHELQNHNIYRAFAGFYAHKGYSLLEKYYIMRADEELNHHRWIANYLNEYGIKYDYPDVPSIKIDFDDLLTPIEKTVDVEIETTMLIYDMVDQAEKDHDYLTKSWLMGKDEKRGYLVIEQAEELSLSRAVLDVAKRGTPWEIKAETIMKMYQNS